jgi:hypothetical protein
MNPSLIARIRQHRGKSTTVVPGDGFNLTGAASCTYLHDDAGAVSACLLASAGGGDIHQIAEFFCQQIVLAQRPSERLQDIGITGLAEGPLVIVTYMDGMADEDKESVERSIIALTKKSRHMGHLADWPEGMFL